MGRKHTLEGRKVKDNDHETFGPLDLHAFAAAHGFSCGGSSSDVKNHLFEHIAYSHCDILPVLPALGVPTCPGFFGLEHRDVQSQILLSLLDPRMAYKPLQRLLTHHAISFDANDTHSRLRKTLKQHAFKALKGKACPTSDWERNVRDFHEAWPPTVSDELKAKLP